MATIPFPINQFGGLNFREDPLSVGPNRAIKALNVDLSIPGRLRQRPGYDLANGTVTAGVWDWGVESLAGGNRLTVLRNSSTGKIDTISMGGVVTAAAATWPASSSPWQFAHFGSPTLGSLTFIADDGATGGKTMQKWTGAALANSVGKPSFVAVAPWSNRLVQAMYYAAADTPSGANGDFSTIFFSDAGAPETYTATNWIQVSPGDGEKITAVVTWRDRVFVFKETQVFIFYGETPKADGSIDFLYHRSTLPTPMFRYAVSLSASVFNAASGPDGVYYHAWDGIYRMNAAGVSVSISDDIAQVFSPQAFGTVVPSIYQPHINSGSANKAHLTVINHQVYFGFKNKANTTSTLVYDIDTKKWVLWRYAGGNGGPVFWMPTSQITNGQVNAAFLFDNACNMGVIRFDRIGNDNGAGFTATYQTGYFTPSKDGRTTLVDLTLFGFDQNNNAIVTVRAVGSRVGAGVQSTPGLFVFSYPGSLPTAPVGEATLIGASLSGTFFSLEAELDQVGNAPEMELVRFVLRFSGTEADV